MADKKLYDMQFSIDLDNVFAISLVNKPAIKENFIYLSADEVVLSLDDDKRTVTGAILVPDLKIHRNGRGGEPDYDIMFSADTIEKVSQHYMKHFNQKEVTTDHANKANDVTLTEQWIVIDSEVDKTNALGLDKLPVGTWVGTMLIEDDTIWNEVKQGKFKGFSIEGILEPVELQEQINLKEIIMTKANKVIEDLKVKLGIVEAVVAEIDEPAAEVEVEAADEVETVEVEASESEEAPVEEAEPEYVSVEMFRALEADVIMLTDAVIELMKVIETVIPDEVVEPVEASVESVETPEVVVEATEEVEKEVEEDVDMIVHTESTPKKLKLAKFDRKLSIQDRIKANLGL